jgi:hypothetical protein
VAIIPGTAALAGAGTIVPNPVGGMLILNVAGAYEWIPPAGITSVPARSQGGGGGGHPLGGAGGAGGGGQLAVIPPSSPPFPGAPPHPANHPMFLRLDRKDTPHVRNA